jgi:hypothetical protein
LRIMPTSIAKSGENWIAGGQKIGGGTYIVIWNDFLSGETISYQEYHIPDPSLDLYSTFFTIRNFNYVSDTEFTFTGYTTSNIYSFTNLMNV